MAHGLKSNSNCSRTLIHTLVRDIREKEFERRKYEWNDTVFEQKTLKYVKRRKRKKMGKEEERRKK